MKDNPDDDALLDLETFLVEWKPVRAMFTLYAGSPLETFLVEWKLQKRDDAGLVANPLKPS